MNWVDFDTVRELLFVQFELAILLKVDFSLFRCLSLSFSLILCLCDDFLKSHVLFEKRKILVIRLYS